MRILYVADAASIHTRRWLEYFRDRGDEVHVASFRAFEIRGVTVHLLPTLGLGKLGYLWSLFTLPRIFRKVQPDLVHAHYLTSYGFLAAISRLRPLIVTAWGSDALIAPRQSLILRCFASYAVRQAALVTTLAGHMNQAVAKLGRPVTQIIATPFGVDTDLFKLGLVATTKNIPLVLICTRNFDEVYDVATLINAVKQVISRGYSLQVVLVGGGPLKQKLEELASQLGIAPHISFQGCVEHKVLSNLLAKSDIFVSPAHSDGNNVSLNEAMACGCFPIATDIPANAQWIVHNKNGYLYPPGDVNILSNLIEKALCDHALRSLARGENRLIVESRADWRICARRMEGLYQMVVERYGRI